MPSSTVLDASGAVPRWPQRPLRLRPMKTIAGRCSKSPHSWRACVQRGNVYEFRPPRGTGHEQQGRRYGVIVQADELLPRSVVLVAPTSQSARPASFRPEIDLLGETTRVLVEQVGAVDAGRLGDLVAKVAAEQQWGIDEALLTVLGLRQ
jgi:mRNA interferase MazF